MIEETYQVDELGLCHHDNDFHENIVADRFLPRNSSCSHFFFFVAIKILNSSAIAFQLSTSGTTPVFHFLKAATVVLPCRRASLFASADTTGRSAVISQTRSYMMVSNGGAKFTAACPSDGPPTCPITLEVAGLSLTLRPEPFSRGQVRFSPPCALVTEVTCGIAVATRVAVPSTQKPLHR